MTDLPPIETLRHLLARLKANDIAWFGDRYRAGDLAWLQPLLPAGDYDELGRKVEAGDLNYLRVRLARLEIPGVTMFSSLTALGGTVGAAATGAVVAAEPEPERRPGRFLWAIPFLLLAAILMGFGLSRCGDGTSPSGAATSGDTTIAGAQDTVAANDTSASASPSAATLVKTLESAGNFTVLTSLLDVTDLTTTLEGTGPFTLFAPTDDAFAKLPAEDLAVLRDPRNADQLARVMRYHVVAGAKKAAQLTTGDVVTLDGATLAVFVDGGRVTLNADTDVTATDLIAVNGVIHVIDSVLIPADLEALQGTDATVQLGDDAFGPTTIAGAATTTASPADVNAALQLPRFSTLNAALRVSGVIPTLQGSGPFTVFAPSNEAFAKVPAEVMAALLLPANRTVLAKVLSNHVVAGRLGITDLGPGKLTTLEGSTLDIAPLDSRPAVKVNDGTVEGPEIVAGNGVIHTIDTVLLPADVDLSTLVTNTDAGAAAGSTVPGASAPTGSTTSLPATSLPATSLPTTSVPPSTAVPVTTVAVPEGLTVYFRTGSARLDAAATAKINGALAALRSLPGGSTVKIVGHADAQGNAAANTALSISRADNVKAALEKALGADATELTFDVSAVGSDQPDVDLAKSRKVTIEIQP